MAVRGKKKENTTEGTYMEEGKHISAPRPSVKIITKDLGDHSKDVEQVFVSHVGIPTKLNRF